jgi:ATP/maltotriose-dependent transcriptional regulator MalT
MKDIIQKTKLYFPSARAQLVERPRLLEPLNSLRSPSHRIGLISAPAGSGKTTLVVQWLAGEPGWSAGWVSLDARDNQPARFFTYFITALQTLFPQAGREAMDLLQLPGVNLEEVVTLLTNDLVEITSPFLLVLDDFHQITDSNLCRAIDLFLDAMPTQMSILLLSREDPRLQLARYRANDQLVELRLDELRFTLQEAIAFLEQSMGLNLVPSQVEMLEQRTEGWIAGLQLAALSLKHSSDVDGFLHDFSGSHRYILDYLMEEVLSHQSLEVQDFLLDTSIVEHMCAGLSAAITQKTLSAAQKLLTRLSRANLFIIPLDEEQVWFRYHHLFKDLLLARLEGESPDRASRLYLRASNWYEENGEQRLAVEYALKAQDASRAAHLVEIHFEERWQLADMEFCSLIYRLPSDIIEQSPALCLDNAWFHILSGQFRRVPPLLKAVDKCLSDPDRRPEPVDVVNRAFARTIRAFLDDSQNKPVVIDETLKQALAAIPETNTAMHNSVVVLLATLCYMEGDFTSAIHYCQYALERDKRIDGTIAIPISVMRWVWVLQAQGKLHQALQLIKVHETYVRKRGSRRYYISGALNLMWGEILLEWNQLDEAESQLRTGLHLLEDWPVPQSFTVGMGLLARLQVAKGDVVGARATLQKVEELYQVEDFHPAFVHLFQKAQMCVWIAENNIPAMETFVQKVIPLAEPEPSFRIEAPLVELCRAWTALGRLADAATLLTRLAASARNRNGSLLSILTLLVAAQSGQPTLAQASLGEALRLGEPEGYLRTFIDAGDLLGKVLQDWLQQNRLRAPAALRAYASRLLYEFDRPTSNSIEGSSAVPGLTEALTPRELDVLRLLMAGCSDRQIAEKLILAKGTVKYYVHGILQKLEVHSRTQAIARARELKMLN